MCKLSTELSFHCRVTFSFGVCMRMLCSEKNVFLMLSLLLLFSDRAKCKNVKCDLDTVAECENPVLFAKGGCCPVCPMTGEKIIDY